MSLRSIWRHTDTCLSKNQDVHIVQLLRWLSKFGWKWLISTSEEHVLYFSCRFEMRRLLIATAIFKSWYRHSGRLSETMTPWHQIIMKNNDISNIWNSTDKKSKLYYFTPFKYYKAWRKGNALYIYNSFENNLTLFNVPKNKLGFCFPVKRSTSWIWQAL